MFQDWSRSRREARRRRRERRRLEQEARDLKIRERVFTIVRAVAEPLVADGMATLDWVESDPETGVGPGIRLVPARADAVTVEVFPEWDYVIVHFVRDGAGSYWGATEDLHLRTLTFKQPDGEALEVRAGYHGKTDARELHFPGYR